MAEVCKAPAKPGTLGGPRCGKPATYTTILGPCCSACAELLRASMRSPNTLANVIAGRARTEEEIERLVRPLN